LNHSIDCISISPFHLAGFDVEIFFPYYKTRKQAQAESTATFFHFNTLKLNLGGVTMTRSMKDLPDVKKEAQASLLSLPGVHGVSISLKEVAGVAIQQLAITVHVDAKLDPKQLDSSNLIPKEIGGFPTDVIQGQRFGVPLATRADVVSAPEFDTANTCDAREYRPLRGGCRIAATSGTGFGTLGLICQSTNGKPAILTCAHIVKAKTGTVYQPGDKAKTRGPVAQVTTYDPIIDAASAELLEDILWSNWIIEIGSIQGTYDLQPSDLLGRGYRLQKRGQRTGHAFGRVNRLQYTGIAHDGSTVYDSIIIRSITGEPIFAAPGDSGSVAVNDQNQVLGLNYGMQVDPITGETDYYTRPISAVVGALKIHIYRDFMPRAYMLHQGVGSDRWLWNSFRDNENIQWTPNRIVPNDEDAYGLNGYPAVVAFKKLNSDTYDPNVVTDNLFCIRQDRENVDWSLQAWCGTFDGASWTPDEQIKIKASWPVGATKYRDKLYCFSSRLQYSPDDDRVVTQWLTMSTFDGRSWSDETLVPPNAENTYEMSYAPAAAVYEDNLYVFYAGPRDRNAELHAAIYDGQAWTAGPIKTADNRNLTTSGAPGVATFKGKLYCVREAAGNASWILIAVFDGTQWTELNLSPIPGRTSGPPGLFVYNDRLYCIHEGAWNNGCLYALSTDDGAIWTSDAILLDENGHDLRTTKAPGLAVFQPKLGKAFQYHLCAQNSRGSFAEPQLFVLADGAEMALAVPNGNWKRNVPNKPPEKMRRLTAFSDYIYGLALDGTLYACGLPTGEWVRNHPDEQPVSFVKIAAFNGNFRSPRRLFAIDVNGALWSVEIPSGTWQRDWPAPQPGRLIELAIQDGTDAHIFVLNEGRELWATGLTSTSVWVQNFPAQPKSWLDQLAVQGFDTDPHLLALDVDRNLWGVGLPRGEWYENFPAQPPVPLQSIAVQSGDDWHIFGIDVNNDFWAIGGLNGQWTQNWPKAIPPV
jgi:hypothetical protein